MSTLLLGKNGQVGRALQQVLGPHTALGRDALDVSDLDALRTVIRQHRPRILINASAYTAVDRAEAEPELAHRINAIAVGVMAEEMRALDGWLIHYSTDYVFDGTGTKPYYEDAPTAPMNAYGASKLAGENAVRASGVNHLLLRTSWVYSNDGQNFAKTMLKLAQERDSLRVVADQIGAPTHATLIAETTAALLQQLTAPNSGTYHLVADGETSWHGFALFLISHAIAHDVALRCAAENIAPITSAEYPTPARRPANSRLSCEKLENTFNLTLPDWHIHAAAFITDYARSFA